MDRQLLSKILAQMRKNLKDGKSIGDMKVGALLALGHQLEAIFYYLGHELGTTLKIKQVKDVNQIPSELKNLFSDFNLGEIEITDSTEEVVELIMKNHSSIKDLIKKGIKATGSYCSFEAGLLAGIVEKLSDRNCFAQETGCSLQTGENYCTFMVVFQRGD
jgi:predicted hydrocarbon binding protein